MNGHGLCTADPWVFSAQGIPATTFSGDITKILAANACTATDAIHPSSFCRTLQTDALGAVNNLKRYVWRVAHPTADGQASSPSPRSRRCCSRWAAARNAFESGGVDGESSTSRRRMPLRAAVSMLETHDVIELSGAAPQG